MLIVRGRTTLAVPYYGVGVFMPITIMGLAVRQHMLANYTGRIRKWGALGAGLAAGLGALVFVGQIVGKWAEGGWVVLISFSVLVLTANAILLSPIGFREPTQIHRIVREKARVRGAMASIVEWQSLKMQEYRYGLLMAIVHFFEIFGVRRPLPFAAPVPAGDYDHAVHVDHPEAPSLLTQYLDNQPAPEPHIGAQPMETAGPDPKEVDE
jgi:hypothetical protein